MKITEAMREAFAGESIRQARILADYMRLGFVRVHSQPYPDGAALMQAASSLRGPTGWTTLRVSRLHNDAPAVLTPEANLYFREWHDATHLLLGVGFDYIEEAAVAAHQRRWCAPAYRTLVALDTLAQTEHARAHGAFPAQPREWTNRLALALTEAEEHALRSLPSSVTDHDARQALQSAIQRIAPSL